MSEKDALQRDPPRQLKSEAPQRRVIFFDNLRYLMIMLVLIFSGNPFSRACDITYPNFIN